MGGGYNQGSPPPYNLPTLKKHLTLDETMLLKTQKSSRVSEEFDCLKDMRLVCDSDHVYVLLYLGH